ncbi:beta-lactamase [Aquimarina intermedia]|uniref:Beta-lactamase n=1 Tax=Aquimarina intermedia TaxID=350814 RepID=A0A5S5BWN9_9FLAO|nr:beta-lactamase [Aquimarina intermedia]
MKKYTLILTLIVCFSIHMGFAQVSKDSSLFLALKKADSLLFEEGFNQCNFKALKKVLHEDLEFFHDQNGIQNSEQFYRSFSQSICSNKNFKPIRKLVEETLQVFVLKSKGKVYGAIQTGKHVFYIKEPNKALYATEQARVTNTWLLENGIWRLKRILSYEHRPPEAAYGPKFDAEYVHKLFDKDVQIEDLLRKHKIPSIAIGYIKDGALQQLRTFSVQKKGVPVSSKSVYKVASLTKPIVAMVVLKLIEEGQ